MNTSSPFCLFINGITNAVPSINGCPISQYYETESIDGWLLTISQIGYTNGHAILAFFTLFIIIASFIQIIQHQKDMVGTFEWESLDAYQRLFSFLHCFSLLLSVSFVAGFITHVLYKNPSWIMLSSLNEIFLFGFQVNLSLIVIHLWLRNHASNPKLIYWIVGLLYFIPSLLYLICICSFAGRASTSNLVLGKLCQILYIIINGIRFLLAGISLLFTLQKYDSYKENLGNAQESVLIFVSDSVISLSTCIYSTLSILFTLGLFCPTNGIDWIQFYEWHYYLVLCIECLFYALTYNRLSNDLSVSSHKYAKKTRPRLPFGSPTSTTFSTVSPNLMSPTTTATTTTPRSPFAFLKRTPKTKKTLSETTLVTKDLSEMELIEQDKIETLNRLLTWIGLVLGVVICGILLLDMFYIRDGQRGLITCLLVTSCFSLGGHFFIHFTSSKPFEWKKSKEYISSGLLGVLSILGVILSITLSSNLSIYFAYALWPITTLLIVSDTTRFTKDANQNLLSINSSISNTVNKISPLFPSASDSLSPSEKNLQVWKRAVWRFARSFLGILIPFTAIISILSGLYLPVSLSIIITCSAIILYNLVKTSKVWLNLLLFQGLIWLIVIFSIGLSILLPIFISKSWDNLAFVQNQRFSKGTNDKIAGYYYDYEYLVDRTSNANRSSSIGTFTKNQNVYYDIRDKIELARFVDRSFCSIGFSQQTSYKPIFLTSDLKTLISLLSMGLPKDYIVYEQPKSSQVPLDMSFVTTNGTDSLIRFDSFVLNPFMTLANHLRNRKSIILFDAETDPFIRLTKYSGADYDIVRDAPTYTSSYASSNSFTSGSGLSQTVSGTEQAATVISKSESTPLISGWILAAVILPVILLCTFATLFIYYKSIGKTFQFQNDSSLLFKRIISVERSLDQSLLLVEMVSCIGWLIFVVGGAGAINTSGYILDPPVLTFIFVIFGLTSSVFTYISGSFKSRNRANVIVGLILLGLSLLGAGSVLQNGSLQDLSFQGIRLMMTGSALFGAFHSIGVGISAAKRSREDADLDIWLQILSAVNILGSILIMIAFGRLKVDYSYFAGVAFAGIAITTFLGDTFVVFSTFYYHQSLNSIGVSLQSASLYFVGGILGFSGLNIASCNQNPSFNIGCKYHWILTFIGGFFCLFSSLSIILIKLYQFESEEELETRMIAQLQIKEIERENLASPTKETAEALQSLKGIDNNDSIYEFLSFNPNLWNIWRFLALGCFLSWIIFLGGFGSLADKTASDDIITSAILFTLFGPICLVGLILSVLRNSRKLMSFAILICAFTIATIGRLITTTWFNPLGSSAAIYVGCALFILLLFGMIGMIFYRIRIQIDINRLNDGVRLSQKGITISFQVACFILFIGILLSIIGIGIGFDSKDLSFLRVTTIGPIIGIVLSCLTLLAFLINFYLVNEEEKAKLNGSNVLFDSKLLFSMNALTFILSFGAFLGIGSALYISGSLLNICTKGTGSCKQGYTSTSLVFMGSLLSLFGSLTYLILIIIYGQVIGNTATPIPSVSKSDSKPSVLEEDKIDIYAFILSWPLLHHIVKSCIALQMVSYLTFVVSFANLAVYKLSWDHYFVGGLPFAISGFITPLHIILWIYNGNYYVQYLYLVMLAVNNSFAAYAFCWSVSTPSFGYTITMAISSLMFIIASSGIFIVLMSWCSFRDASLQSASISKYTTIAAFAFGWLLYLIGFIIQHILYKDGVDIKTIIGGWIFVIFGFVSAIFVASQSWNLFPLQIASNFCLSLSISFAGASFIANAIQAAESKPEYFYIIQILGSIVFVFFMTGLSIYKSAYSYLEISSDGLKKLIWLSRISPYEKKMPWIRQPQFKQSLFIYLICSIITLIGIFIHIATFIIAPQTTNVPFVHAFFVSTVAGLVGHGFYIYLRWTAFGWLFTLSLISSGITSGLSVQSLLNASSTNSTSLALVAGIIFSVIGSSSVFILYIWNMKISQEIWFIRSTKAIVVGLSLAWGLTLVGVILSGSLVSAILSISFPGLVAILYFVTVHFWKPKAPKKTLTEYLGYTIVKKKDLREALQKSSSREGLNNAAEEPDEKMKKNPIYNMIKKKEKPVNVDRNMDDYLEILFGSQAVSIGLVLLSMLVHGITLYSLKSNTKTYTLILSVGAILCLVFGSIYIFIVSWTCFIDETHFSPFGQRPQQQVDKDRNERKDTNVLPILPKEMESILITNTKSPDPSQSTTMTKLDVIIPNERLSIDIKSDFESKSISPALDESIQTPSTIIPFNAVVDESK